MIRKLSTAFLLLTLCVGTTVAGLRGPGKYAGVVIFDRWDTCYLYSGIYLMYVSNKTKVGLRKYEGRSVLIDAKEVSQPMNPGDGLIGKYEFLGLAESKGLGLAGLTLKVVPQFSSEGDPKFLLEIDNGTGNRRFLSTYALALTLFGLKRDDVFSPSDGKSDAWLTRLPFKYPSPVADTILNRKRHVSWGESEQFYFDFDEKLPDQVEIGPNQKRGISLYFHLPKGEYDFLCGYGGGVHEDKGLASNLVAFSVDKNGKAKVDDVAPHK